MRRGAVIAVPLLVLLVILSGLLRPAIKPAPHLFLVTPTRDALTRYPHMLMIAHAVAASSIASRIVWVVGEDAIERDPAIELLLQTSGIQHHYLSHQTLSSTVHRGVELRNAALDFLAIQSQVDGVVYFADDDNAYDPELWAQLVKVPRHAYTIFSVGNTGYYGFEGPVIAQNNASDAVEREQLVTVEQWCCDYCVRRWNVDMGGFAFHTSLLGQGSASEDDPDARPGTRFDLQTESGFLETDFLQQLESQPHSQFVLLPELVRRVHVWHNYGKPFDRAGLYDADWTTAASLAFRLRNASDAARGFAWAAEDLPQARFIVA